MAARSVGSLFIDIEARTARLEKDLGKARGLLQRMTRDTGVMSKAFSGAFTMARAAVAAFASVYMIRSIGRMTMATLEAFRAQMQLAEATGLSVNDLKAYQEASEHLGVTNLNLTKTMKELFVMQSDVSRGMKEAIMDVQDMGMTVGDFLALRPAELFETMVAQLNKIPDPAKRSALAFKVFGKEATNLSSLLAQGTGAIAHARKEMERLGHVVNQYDEARVAVAMNAVSELGDRWEVFKKRLSIGLTPLIYTLTMRLADMLAKVDIEKFALKISTWTVALINLITTVPKRFKILMNEVKLIWLEFIAQFDTGTEGSMLGKLFGTQAANEAKAQEVRTQLAQMKAELKTFTASLDSDFQQKVQEWLDKVLQLPAIVVDGTKTISEGTVSLVKSFASSFSTLADITDNFLDGESVKFGDWFREIVKTMIKTFMKVSLINPLLNAMFGGMLGSKWDMLPALFGPGASPGGAGMARGGPMMAGDTHLVGEHGPEVVSFGRSGYITPNDRMVNRGGSSSGGGVKFEFNQHFASGLQRAELAAIVPTIIQQSKVAVMEAVVRGGSYRRAMAG